MKVLGESDCLNSVALGLMKDLWPERGQMVSRWVMVDWDQVVVWLGISPRQA